MNTSNNRVAQSKLGVGILIALLSIAAMPVILTALVWYIPGFFHIPYEVSSGLGTAGLLLISWRLLRGSLTRFVAIGVLTGLGLALIWLIFSSWLR